MSRVWESFYRGDRRKHRHRCRACWTILGPGQRVLMIRWQSGRTWAVHAQCADKREFQMTWRERFEAWAAEIDERVRA